MERLRLCHTHTKVLYNYKNVSDDGAKINSTYLTNLVVVYTQNKFAVSVLDYVRLSVENMIRSPMKI